jgi:8-oxo-dGTP pyrophosphatase MutT (NUDIX family)
MLDLDPKREGVPPRPAATVLWIRERNGDVEVFCVERNKKARFLGGAIVFPGGKVDPTDGEAGWPTNAPRAPRDPSFADEATLRALLVAVCRESLEEAALLPLAAGTVTHDELLELRKMMAANELSLRDWLGAGSRTLDLAALRPFARWITPKVEARRYDTRFFVAVAPNDQPGAHDNSETMASFWTTPTAVLERFARSEVQLAPPTHRTLEQIEGAKTAADVFAIADANVLEPVCPELVQGEGTLALVLPGDPEHSIREARLPGKSRYVLRGEHWRAEDAP